MNTTPRKLRIYACGGCALNIVSTFENIKNTDNTFAQIDACYIDTSKSNLFSKNLPQEKIYLFEDMDGSGKIRAANSQVISKNSLAILQKFTPDVINIVVHSASGGSGSVIAPSLVSELKANGAKVIVIIVGSTDTIKETENTFKTLETYESISKLRNSSTITHYLENGKSGRTDVDQAAIYAISLIAGLYGGQHSELDTADLGTWLEYATMTTGVPTIASLTFPNTKEEFAKLDKIVSVATLATPSMNTRIEPTVPYQAVGFVPQSWVDSKQPKIGEHPINYVISFDLLKTTYASLKKSVQENNARTASFVVTNTFMSPSTTPTENGLVL